MTRALLAALTVGAAMALAGMNQALPQSPAATPATPSTPAPLGSQPAATPAQPSATPNPLTAAATTTAAAPAAPSPAFLRRAREAGFKPETHNGVTRYCMKDDKSDTGTHLPAPKRCYDESQVMAILDQRQQDRDALRGMSELNISSK